MATSGSSDGPATDSANNPVVDPTKNVLDLVNQQVKRMDDLRAQESMHMRELLGLRSDHFKELRDAESRRIDAIRAVDVGAVNRAAEVAATQASTLAATVTVSAETLRTQVQAAAQAQTIALAAALVPIQEAVADLRRVQYEQQGMKASVVESRDAGASTGMWVGIAIAIVGLVLSAVVLVIGLR